MTAADVPQIPAGLTDSEAAARQQREGYNELPRERRRTPLRIAAEVAREPMFQLLVAAGVIYLFLGDVAEASMLLAFVVITVTITIVQEQRSENVLQALRDLSSPRALVIRSGQRKRIAGREVVRGDVIVLAEGDLVPADALVISAHELRTNESMLTGEPVPVRKVASRGTPAVSRPGGDDLPFVFSGTLVVHGRGIAEVCAIGAASEIGKIGHALSSIESQLTPLHAQTRRLVRVFSIFGLALSAGVVALYGLTRGNWLDGVLAGITLAMAMLPEEFALILSVFMAMGAWRISQRGVLTRRAATIETLGAATVLCSDKTGTLTLNRMSIAELQVDAAAWSAAQEELPELFHPLLEFGILASPREAVDPMEKALHDMGQRYLTRTEHLHGDWALAQEYGLSPGLLAMSQVWKALDREHHVIAAKGSPEAVADLCHLSPQRLDEVRRAAGSMAARGLRVLGVAKASFVGVAWPGTQHAFDFEFLGLVGLSDPLRPGVRDAVNECRMAGIKVAMITGDYPATAMAIAQQAGIDVAGGVVSGEELERLSEDELCKRVANAGIFARIMPEQKLRIVNAFKRNGEVVAMTGDGVNDAPSLKAAHIGIAMGTRGTDVAREASSIVLLDDDFSSIVHAVRAGRRIYDNLRKAMAFVVAVHVPIAGLTLLPLLLGWPIIFTPIHIAFLELVIDPVCSIVFEAEPEERDVMHRSPRDPRAPLFSAALIAWSLIQGAAILLVVGAAFAGFVHLGWPAEQARAGCFVALVISNFGLIVLNRSFSASVVLALRRRNRTLWRMLAGTTILLAATLFIPQGRELFRFGALEPGMLAAALGIGIVTTMLLALLKKLAREMPVAGHRAVVSP